MVAGVRVGVGIKVGVGVVVGVGGPVVAVAVAVAVVAAAAGVVVVVGVDLIQTKQKTRSKRTKEQAQAKNRKKNNTFQSDTPAGRRIWLLIHIPNYLLLLITMFLTTRDWPSVYTYIYILYHGYIYLIDPKCDYVYVMILITIIIHIVCPQTFTFETTPIAYVATQLSTIAGLQELFQPDNITNSSATPLHLGPFGNGTCSICCHKEKWPQQ